MTTFKCFCHELELFLRKTFLFLKHLCWRENRRSQYRKTILLENTHAGGKISALQNKTPLFTKISLFEMWLELCWYHHKVLLLKKFKNHCCKCTPHFYTCTLRLYGKFCIVAECLSSSMRPTPLYLKVDLSLENYHVSFGPLETTFYY